MNTAQLIVNGDGGKFIKFVDGNCCEYCGRYLDNHSIAFICTIDRHVFCEKCKQERCYRRLERPEHIDEKGIVITEVPK